MIDQSETVSTGFEQQARRPQPSAEALTPQQLDATLADAFVKAISAHPPKLEQGQSTVAAMFAAVHRRTGVCHMLGLGMGTRCVGYDPLESAWRRAVTIRDCHAEVLARRAALVTLLEQALLLAKETRLRGAEANVQSELLEANAHGGFQLRPEMMLALVINKVPCGDAAIGALESTHGGRIVVPPSKVDALAPVPTHQDAYHGHLVSKHMNGVDDTRVCSSRVKPGKGTPSLSMSCSDKIAKWVARGLGGRALRTLLVANLQLVLVLGDEGADEAALRRAVLSRWLPDSFVTDPDKAVRVSVSAVNADAIHALLRKASDAPISMSPVASAVSMRALVDTKLSLIRSTVPSRVTLNSKSGLTQGATERSVDKMTAVDLPFTLDLSQADKGMRVAMPSGSCVLSPAYRCMLTAALLALRRRESNRAIDECDGVREIRATCAELKEGGGEEAKSEDSFFDALLPFSHWVEKPRPDFGVVIKMIQLADAPV